ncbi:MAG: hypothetical protein ACK56I_37465, partial [bacterium]
MIRVAQHRRPRPVRRNVPGVERGNCPVLPRPPIHHPQRPGPYRIDHLPGRPQERLMDDKFLIVMCIETFESCS